MAAGGCKVVKNHPPRSAGWPAPPLGRGLPGESLKHHEIVGGGDAAAGSDKKGYRLAWSVFSSASPGGAKACPGAAAMACRPDRPAMACTPPCRRAHLSFSELNLQHCTAPVPVLPTLSHYVNRLRAACVSDQSLFTADPAAWATVHHPACGG